MARLKEVQLYKLIASDMDKSPAMVQKYIDALINRIFVEMNRGNEVTIRGFGTFAPILRGGKEKMFMGEKKFIEPRILIDFSMTDSGIKTMNNSLLTEDIQKKIQEGKLKEYEKQILKEHNNRDKKSVVGMFETVVEQLGEDDESEEDE